MRLRERELMTRKLKKALEVLLINAELRRDIQCGKLNTILTPFLCFARVLYHKIRKADVLTVSVYIVLKKVTFITVVYSSSLVIC